MWLGESWFCKHFIIILTILGLRLGKSTTEIVSYNTNNLKAIFIQIETNKRSLRTNGSIARRKTLS